MSGEDNISDKYLGRLSWNQELTTWEGKVKIPRGNAIPFAILDERKEGTSTIEAARPYVSAFVESPVRPKEYAADDLLENYNKHWGKKRGIALSKDEFIARLSIESLYVIPGLFMRVFLDDGDIYGGHSIVVMVLQDGSKKSVAVAG